MTEFEEYQEHIQYTQCFCRIVIRHASIGATHMLYGKIISSSDGVPTDNDQSSFGTGYSYQYGEDNTIIVRLDDGWHIFVSVAESDASNRNMDGLSEQEQTYFHNAVCQ